MMPFYKVPAVTSNDGGPRRVRAPLRHSVNNGGSAANTSRDRDVMGVQRTSSADKSKLQSLSHSDKVKSVSHEDALYHDPLQTLIFCIVSRADKRYNTPDTGCLECYRPHASVNTTTPKIDRKHMHCRQMPEIRAHTIYTVKIVNKRPRNLLNEIQNVFINGIQVKTARIMQIIPVISTILRHNNYRQLTASLYTGHMREQ